jgi:hypothetical protein
MNRANDGPDEAERCLGIRFRHRGRLKMVPQVLKVNMTGVSSKVANKRLLANVTVVKATSRGT